MQNFIDQYCDETDGPSEFACNNCNELDTISEKVFFIDLPDTLVLNILRFGANYDKTTDEEFPFLQCVPINIPMNVQFSSNHLSMQQADTALCNLKSIVCHDSGLLQTGHYTSFTNSECKGKNIFVKCDDMKNRNCGKLNPMIKTRLKDPVYSLFLDHIFFDAS